jgi:hypothetical protein
MEIGHGIVAPLLFHVARRRKGVPGSQAIQMAGSLFWIEPAVACADKQIVQP